MIKLRRLETIWGKSWHSLVMGLILRPAVFRYFGSRQESGNVNVEKGLEAGSEMPGKICS